MIGNVAAFSLYSYLQIKEKEDKTKATLEEKIGFTSEQEEDLKGGSQLRGDRTGTRSRQRIPRFAERERKQFRRAKAPKSCNRALGTALQSPRRPKVDRGTQAFSTSSFH